MIDRTVETVDEDNSPPQSHSCRFSGAAVVCIAIQPTAVAGDLVLAMICDGL